MTEANQAVSDGFLIENGNGLVPNSDQGRVGRASQAVDVLADALGNGGFELEFYEWFKNEYDGPPKLHQGAIWRSVFWEVNGLAYGAHAL